MGKTRDFFRKIGGMKGIFHARMGRIKDKNSKDLTEAEEIKKRWQELVQKNGINDLDNHKGVVTHLESGILECEVMWASGSITRNKASGGDGIPVELLYPHVPGNKLTQKDNADSGLQFITLVGARQSLLLAKEPNQFL